MNRIDNIVTLESVIGKTPAAVSLKVIDHIDATARRWLAASPLMFAGLGGSAGLGVTLAGGDAGFAKADTTILSIPCAAIDDRDLLVPGAAFGSLFLVPGIGETLRINGTVAEADGAVARIAVSECYVHCAKALIRSDFWQAVPGAPAHSDPAGFVADSRFIALATVDGCGAADLSPKGDPAGLMARLEDDRLWFADRPGNRRADSFCNIIVQPRIAAALLVPGSSQVALVRGQARLTTDETARATFAVRDKAPLLATCVEDLRIELHPSAALERARLWPAATAPADIRPAKMFAEHVKLNRNKGIGARVAGAIVSVPGMMQKALEKDYKDNLY